MRSVQIIGLVALVSLVGLFVAGCGNNDHETHEHGKVAPKNEEPAVADIAQKTCPVMGGKIDTNIHVDHDGRRVYFCCAGCIDTFKKDPKKYLAKIDAEIQKAKAGE
jgi:YHS domain-containing protein